MKGYKGISLLLVFLLGFFFYFSYGDGSVNAATNTLVVDKTTPLYNEPDMTKKNGASISPQTVTVLEERSNGWYKINTWLGEKWIAPKGIKETITSSAKIYNEPSFLKYASASISPQTITVIDKRTDGWWLVKTWLGDKWIAPNGMALTLNQFYTLYNDASFTYSTGASVGNQTVTAIDQKANGWWQIKTWLGDKWININDLGFGKPLNVNDYRVSSTFGPRTGGFHYGIDIAKSGTVPIVAAAGGTVTRASSFDSYGNVVFVQHTINGKLYETVYAHLRSISVSKGATVTKGQLLGYMGNTGNSSGQHLHFEIHEGPWLTGRPNAVDPSLYIKF